MSSPSINSPIKRLTPLVAGAAILVHLYIGSEIRSEIGSGNAAFAHSSNGGGRGGAANMASAKGGGRQTNLVNALPVKGKPALQATVHDKWAVLVGVGHYQDSAIKPIKYATRNVLSLTQNFCDPQVGRFLPDHVLIATDEKVTRESLADSTWENWLSKKALPSDMIVLYFCLRFVPTDDVSDILLLTNESKVANKETTGSSLSGILTEIRRRTQCKNIVALLDIAPTETASKNFPYGFGKLMEAIAQKSGVSILCADDRMLGSLDDAANRQSFFAEYISEGIKAGGGASSLEAVSSYVSQILANQHPPAGTYASHPLLFKSQENPEAVKLVIGQTVHKPGDVSKVKFGHPLSEVAKTNPALARHLAELGAQGESNPAKAMFDQAADAEESSPKKETSQKKQTEDDDDDDEQSDVEVDFKPYMATMKKAIQDKWVTPKGLAGKTIVTVFSIQRDGHIVDPEIVESSGNAEIDKSALKAIADASPLSPLPKGSPKKVQLRYKFDWKVTH